MLQYFDDLIEVKEMEKRHFYSLQLRWNSLDEQQKRLIEELEVQMKSQGALCSRYDFLPAF